MLCREKVRDMLRQELGRGASRGRLRRRRVLRGDLGVIVPAVVCDRRRIAEKMQRMF